MSTRSNIEIVVNGTVEMIYRHYDGYVAETGGDLAEFVRCALQAPLPDIAEEVAEALIAWGTETRNNEITKWYEVTDGVHGDIDHFYRLSLVDGEWVIYHAARKLEDYGDQRQRWIDGGSSYTLENWVQVVNFARIAANKRIDEMEQGCGFNFTRFEQLEV